MHIRYLLFIVLSLAACHEFMPNLLKNHEWCRSTPERRRECEEEYIYQAMIAAGAEKYSDSILYINQGIALTNESSPAVDPIAGKLALANIDYLISLDQYSEAEYRLGILHSQVEQTAASATIHHSQVLFEISVLAQRLGVHYRAESALSACHEIRLRSLGASHTDTQIAKYWLDRVRDYINGEKFKTDRATQIIAAILADHGFKNGCDAFDCSVSRYRRIGTRGDRHLWRTLFSAIRLLINHSDPQSDQLSKEIDKIFDTIDSIRERVTNLEGNEYTHYADTRRLRGHWLLRTNDLRGAEREFTGARDFLVEFERKLEQHNLPYDEKRSTLIGVNKRRSAADDGLEMVAVRTGDLALAERYARESLREYLFDYNRESLSAGDVERFVNSACHYASIGEHIARQGRGSDAAPFLETAMHLIEANIRRSGTTLREEEILSAVISAQCLSTVLYDLVAESPDDVYLTQLAASASLLLQGRLIDELSWFSRYAVSGRSVPVQALAKLRQNLLGEISKTAYGGMVHPDPNAQQDRINKLEYKLRQVEASLAKHLAVPDFDAPWPKAIRSAVKTRIPPGSVYVNYIKFEKQPTTGNSVSRHRYLAIILHADGKAYAVSLGDAQPIDKAANQLRHQLAVESAEYQGSARALFDLVIRPVLPKIGKVQKLMIAPDGQLHSIPFAILNDGAALLGERFEITYLSSGRDLLRPSEDSLSTDVLIFADIDYSSSLASGEPTSGNEHQRLLRRAVSPSRANRYRPLPETGPEADDIKALFPGATVLRQKDATEAALLRLRAAPGVLHIATHGEYLTDGDDQEADSRGPRLPFAEGQPIPANPLLRSRLIFAGAGNPPAGGKLGGDDGLTSALEIGGLSLQGTQLVVLSACETARGYVVPGQDVAGLRRAFLVSGAQTVVASLWAVNDGATRALMRGFYQHLRRGQGRAQAMQQAALSLRQEYPHPHYWAGFIVIGNGSPLHDMATSNP